MIIQDRVILITGGARRIGRAIALSLAERGARIAFSYRSSAADARQMLASLRRAETDALAVRADLSRAADVKRMIERVLRRFGRLDVLVNSAANFYRTPFSALTERDREAMLATIGATSVEALFAEIPEGVRFRGARYEY